MKQLDRFLTIVVTVTLTSAFWILFGSAYTTEWLQEEAAGDATPSASVEPAADASQAGQIPDALESPVAQAPGAGDSATLMIPVQGVAASQLTDTFADERGGGTRLHEALDIMAPRGTPVLAAAPGTIEKVFQSDAGGNTLYVRSNDRRTIYYYAHLDAYAPNLREKVVVRRGQVLGTVGSTGNASPEGPHLHFAIMRTTPDADWWEPSSAVNPYPMLAATAAAAQR